MPSNRDAVTAGDHRQALVTLLETLAEQLDTTEAQIHAQLAAQYRGAWAELVALDANKPPQEVSPLDEIAARRAARGGDATDRGSAPRRRKHSDGG